MQNNYNPTLYDLRYKLNGKEPLSDKLIEFSGQIVAPIILILVLMYFFYYYIYRPGKKEENQA